MRDRSSAASPASRYPSQPVPCVGAVILARRAVVIVKRGQPPLRGRWTLPGGRLELGETVRAGVAREAREETGLVVEVGALVDLVEHVATDPDGRVEYHYLIADYLCRPVGGSCNPGDDVEEACWVPVDALGPYALTASATAVIRRAVEMYSEEGELP